MIEFPRTREGKKGGGKGGGLKWRNGKGGVEAGARCLQGYRSKNASYSGKDEANKSTHLHIRNLWKLEPTATPTPPPTVLHPSDLSDMCGGNKQIPGQACYKLYSWTCKLHGLCTPGSEITPHCSLRPV